MLIITAPLLTNWMRNQRFSLNSIIISSKRESIVRNWLKNTRNIISITDPQRDRTRPYETVRDFHYNNKSKIIINPLVAKTGHIVLMKLTSNWPNTWFGKKEQKQVPILPIRFRTMKSLKIHLSHALWKLDSTSLNVNWNVKLDEKLFDCFRQGNIRLDLKDSGFPFSEHGLLDPRRNHV